jgi:hypothetical protein
VSYRRSRVRFPPQFFLSLLAAAALSDSIVGCLLCRSPLSTDLVTQPPPTPASGEAMTSVPELPCNKRARREDASGNLGCAEEDRRSPRLEPAASETKAKEPTRPEAPANAASSPAAATEAEPTQAGEAVSAEAVTSPPAISEIATGDVAAASGSSDPPGQEDTREAAVKTVEEAPAPARLPEASEPAVRTPSSSEVAPNTRAVAPTFGAGAGVAAGPLFFGLASNSGEILQGPPTTRVVGSERGEASPAPEVATRDASRGKAPATAAGSGVGSLSSACQLPQDWVDTASSAEARGKLKVQGSKLTLENLNKQFSTVSESLRNVNLQFLDAVRTTDVSTTSLTFDFFCWLGGEARSSMADFSMHPSPRVSR